MSFFLSVVLSGLLLLGQGVVWAKKKPSVAKGGRTSDPLDKFRPPPPKQIFRLEGMVVTGETEKPSAFYLLDRSPMSYSATGGGHIAPRDFNGLIIRSVQQRAFIFWGPKQVPDEPDPVLPAESDPKQAVRR